jgi:hypothetical protein
LLLYLLVSISSSSMSYSIDSTVIAIISVITLCCLSAILRDISKLVLDLSLIKSLTLSTLRASLIDSLTNDTITYTRKECLSLRPAS